MSWDIVIFNLNRKVTTVGEIDESVLENISGSDFRTAIANYFNQVEWHDDFVRIVGHEYELECSVNENDNFSNAILHVYGEQGIYAIIDFCKKNGWQLFDTGLGEMLDLEYPERNGYLNFQNYLHQIQNSGKDKQ